MKRKKPHKHSARTEVNHKLKYAKSHPKVLVSDIEHVFQNTRSKLQKLDSKSKVMEDKLINQGKEQESSKTQLDTVKKLSTEVSKATVKKKKTKNWLSETCSLDLSDAYLIQEHNKIIDVQVDRTIEICPGCMERVFKADLKNKMRACFRCTKKNAVIWPSLRKIPPELQNLSNAEQIMIAEAVLQVYIVKLGFKKDNDAVRGLKQNTIAFPVTGRNERIGQLLLPRPLHSRETTSNTSQEQEESKDLQLLQVFVYKGTNFESLSNEQRQKLDKTVFGIGRVRRNVVFEAIKWKSENNGYVHEVNVNWHFLQSLPDDGLYPLTIEYVDGIIDSETYNTELNSDEADASIFVADCPCSKQEMTFQAWKKLAQTEKIYIAVNNTPLNEYDYINYLQMVFPVLFPVKSLIPETVSLKEIARHFLCHEDSRFRKEPRFYLTIFSMLRRQEIIKNTKFIVRPGKKQETISVLKSLSAEDWRSIAQQLNGNASFYSLFPKLHECFSSIEAISNTVRNSIGYKKQQRRRLKAMFVKRGAPFIWFTIAPNDFRNPFVMQMGQVSPESVLPEQRQAFVRDDPVAACDFFRLFAFEAIDLLQRILNMDDFFAVVESQFRGTLHLHLLGWNAEYVNWTDADFVKIADTILCTDRLTDDEFSKGMKDFDSTFESPYNIARGPIRVNTIEELRTAARRIAMQTNTHLATHTPTCFKQTSKKSNQHPKCRFGFPKESCQQSRIEPETGRLEIRRSEESKWMNVYCIMCASLFRCNHDIQILPNAKTDDILSWLYYLTNYATKCDSSVHNIADLISTAYSELENQIGDRNTISAAYWSQRVLIRTLNLITGRKEVAAQTIVNELLNYEDEYSSITKWIKFYTYPFLKYFNVLTQKEEEGQILDSEEPETDSEEVTEESNKQQDSLQNLILESSEPSSLVQDYIHRGDKLNSLSPYEYVWQISRGKLSSKRNTIFQKFDTAHPKSGKLGQVKRQNCSSACVVIIGPLWERLSNFEFAVASRILFTNWKSKDDLQDINNSIELVKSLAMTNDYCANFAMLRKSHIVADQRRNTQSCTQENDNGHRDVSKDNLSMCLADDFVEISQVTLQATEESLKPNNVYESVFNLTALQNISLYALPRQVNNAQDQNNCNRQDSRQQTVENDIQVLSKGLSLDLVQESIQSLIQKNRLNIEQELVFRLAIECLCNSNYKSRCIITGEAGTGKSRIINAVKDFAILHGMNDYFQITASTGTAASKLSAPTIHSFIDYFKAFDPTKPLNKESLKKLLQLRLLIIDEYSMIGVYLFKLILEKCRLIRDSSDEFADLSIFFFGDFYQLPPVKSIPLYGSPKASNEDKQIIKIWQSIDMCIILSDNYRQKEDAVLADICRKWKNADMQETHWKILKSRILSAKSFVDSQSYIEDFTCIVSRNNLREQINNLIIQQYVALKRMQLSDPNYDVLCIQPIHKCVTADLSNIQEYLRSLPDSASTKYLPGDLRVFPGCKLVIVSNLDTNNGIAKGSACIFSEYDSEEDKLIIELPFQVNNSKLYSLKRQTATFQFKGHKISRCQFPVVVGFAVTDYRAQGETMRTAIIDLRKPPSGNWNAYSSVYVMLSRLTNLQGLHILCDFDTKSLNLHIPDHLKKETLRMKAKYKETIQKTRLDGFSESENKYQVLRLFNLLLTKPINY